jgi:secondary thiamine-phosphate synthase enzyme
MLIQKTFKIKTAGRGLVDITMEVNQLLSSENITQGLCNVFLHHTSASLTLGENYDPSVLVDLEAFMARLIPDGDSLFKHTAEGPDDMPSHVRSVLTQNSINIPIVDKKLALGTWQGLFLWEHRLAPHERKITVTLQGMQSKPHCSQ